MSATPMDVAPELASQNDDDFEIKVGSFMEVDYAEPHLARGRRLLRKHPEIAKLFGRNPWTSLMAIGSTGFQLLMGWFLVFGAESLFGVAVPWWGVLIAAWVVGAFPCNMNSAIIHEVSHDRVFKNRTLNEMVGWIANLPNLLPVSSSFRLYHMKHHRFQGDPEFDADMASEAEAKLFGNTFIGKLAWEFSFTIVQSMRTSRFVKNKRIPFVTPYVIANIIIQFAFDALLFLWLGPMGLLYFAASFIFSLGPHPLGARYVQEHFIFHKNQETYSYYGPMNALTLNVYHHNEHHDFPAVPWHNLPKLRRMVPEVYDELYSHDSLFKLWLRFLFDPAISLHRRIVRHYDFDKKAKAAPANQPVAEAAE